MRKVKSNLCPIDLNVFIRFSDDIQRPHYWVIRNLYYAGESFEGDEPEEIEKISVNGLTFDLNQMNEFSASVNQIFEGTFTMFFSEKEPNKPDIALEAEVYDGEIWEVGGQCAERFLSINHIEFL